MSFFLLTYGEKTCTDIWTMDNNINGISLYKVSLHLCTEGIMTPSFIANSNTMFLDGNTQILNITNKTNTHHIIQNITNNFKNTSNVNISFIPKSETTTPAPVAETTTPAPVTETTTPAPVTETTTPAPVTETTTPAPVTETTTPAPVAEKLLSPIKTPSTDHPSKMNDIVPSPAGLEPGHIVLISIGSTIFTGVLILIVYIIVKKNHCSNKICHNEEKKEEVKSTIYTKPDTTNENEQKKNNVKLTINTQREKLRALERFKNSKNPILKRESRFKVPIPKINSINNIKKQSIDPLKSKKEPKYPSGMDSPKIQKTKQLPYNQTTPPTSTNSTLLKPIVQPPKLTENGDDIV